MARKKKVKSVVKAEAKLDFDNFKTTADIKVPDKMIDQVIGQEDAVNVIKKAAKQRRHVLLIGEPGTGKSMLGMALAELLPKEKLVDILSFPNPNDENQPMIRTLPAGNGRDIVFKAKLEALGASKGQSIILFVILIGLSVFTYWLWTTKQISDIIFAASLISTMLLAMGMGLFFNMARRGGDNSGNAPKVIVDNYNKKEAQFMDATGAHAGALLGDVLHDPFQSGGLGTPAHERVVAGMIHKANMGVLFIDEIATLQAHTQQELLTALQEGKFAITGQSERSAGAMVRTEPVPCNFILVAAGNMETVKHLHPALRSRIKGYGYEIYMKDTFPDTPDNRKKIVAFVAQEVIKDKKIPHFTREAVDEIILQSRRMANRKGHLTLRFRELGGIVRAAGDLAVDQAKPFVEKEDVRNAKKLARTLEHQIADQIIEQKRDYQLIKVTGSQVGRVNGLAVFGDSVSNTGILLSIEAEVTPGSHKTTINATGGLQTIAKESIINVSALVKSWFDEDLQSNKDIYIQFLQTHGVEGDSASIAIATVIISALKKIPIRQDVAMTGSLSVRGEVLPVGGVSSKVEAAIDAGVKIVLVPESNMQDIIVPKDKLDKIRLVPVKQMNEVLKEALVWKGKEALLKRIMAKGNHSE